jgi:hypothetical protein
MTANEPGEEQETTIGVRLERRYRRLLLSYPPGPRRAELLDTLIEGAHAGGRRRPSARQVANLLRCGLRARLGHPRSRGIVVLATLIALLAGVFGAAAVAPLGWRTAPALPSGTESDSLKREVFPGLVAWGGGDAARWVPTGDGEGEQYGFADYWVWHTAETRDVTAYTTGVRDRLAAGGWTIRHDVELTGPEADNVGPAWRSATFTATRGGLILRFDDMVVDKTAPWSTEGSAGFELSRAAPAALWLLVAVVGLIAVALAWLLTGWVARRVEGRRLRRAVIVVAAAGGLAVLLPATAFAMLWAANSDHPPLAEEVWFLGLRYVLGWLGQPVLVAGCAVFLVAAFPGRSEWARPVRAATFGAAVLALLAAGSAGRLPDLLDGDQRPVAAAVQPCVPVAPAGSGAVGEDRLSYVTRVFVRPEATSEQRNFIEAAIGRTPGIRSFDFYYDPTSQEYRDAYCHGAPLVAGSGGALPHFWQIDLSSPGVLPGLAAEVGAMPGVVAVRPA